MILFFLCRNFHGSRSIFWTFTYHGLNSNCANFKPPHTHPCPATRYCLSSPAVKNDKYTICVMNVPVLVATSLAVSWMQWNDCQRQPHISPTTTTNKHTQCCENPIIIIILGWDITQVLMEGTPSYLHYAEVLNIFQQIEGVQRVHNLRIWALSINKIALSVHLAIGKYKFTNPHTYTHTHTHTGTANQQLLSYTHTNTHTHSRGIT